MRSIAATVGICLATVSRLLARLGLSSLRALEPRPPVSRLHFSSLWMQLDKGKLAGSVTHHEIVRLSKPGKYGIDLS
jgi:hypothetical protein